MFKSFAMFIALSFTSFLSFAAQESQSFDSVVQYPTAESCLATLKKDHPRLLLSEERLKELKAIHEKDPFLQKIVLEVIQQGDGCIKQPPLVHKLIGPRLLSVSRNCLHRVMTLSLCYRWTSDKKYADAAIRDMIGGVCVSGLEPVALSGYGRDDKRRKYRLRLALQLYDSRTA